MVHFRLSDAWHDITRKHVEVLVVYVEWQSFKYTYIYWRKFNGFRMVITEVNERMCRRLNICFVYSCTSSKSTYKFHFLYEHFCWASHLEMSSKRFTLAITALFPASEQTHCALVVYATLNERLWRHNPCRLWTYKYVDQKDQKDKKNQIHRL